MRFKASPCLCNNDAGFEDGPLLLRRRRFSRATWPGLLPWWPCRRSAEAGRSRHGAFQGPAVASHPRTAVQPSRAGWSWSLRRGVRPRALRTSSIPRGTCTSAARKASTRTRATPWRWQAPVPPGQGCACCRTFAESRCSPASLPTATAYTTSSVEIKLTAGG